MKSTWNEAFSGLPGWIEVVLNKKQHKAEGSCSYPRLCPPFS
nr:MAG TPA: hypothetical protein [Caudoviricetes sp.]